MFSVHQHPSLDLILLQSNLLLPASTRSLLVYSRYISIFPHVYHHCIATFLLQSCHCPTLCQDYLIAAIPLGIFNTILYYKFFITTFIIKKLLQFLSQLCHCHCPTLCQDYLIAIIPLGSDSALREP